MTKKPPTDAGAATPEKGLTRRQLLKTGAIVGAASTVVGPAGVAAAAAVTSEPVSPAEIDLILTNGRIHTMDDADSVVRSVAIAGNTIVRTGNNVRGGPNTKVIDLRRRTALPGIVEPHIHVVSLANRPGWHVPIETTDNIAEVQAALAARRPEVPEGEWITSMGGWHENQWAEHRLPTLAELDEAVPDRPVLLYERFTGPCATNSMGKAFFDGVDAADPVHPDQAVIAVADDGFIATGGFGTATPSTTALFILRTLQTFEDKKRSTRDAMALAAKTGMTAMLDQVLFPTPGPLHPSQVLSNLDHYRMYDSWLDLHRSGETFVRLQMNFLHNQSDPELPELHERLRNQFQFFGDDMLHTGSIGEWAAPLSAGDVWFEAQRIVAAAGWRNENSPQNLGALTQVVEAYEAVNAEFGITDLRWMAHHVPEVTTDLLDRMQAMGCGVQAAAYRWVTGSGSGVGAPFRTILDHGVQAGIHGDGVHIAPLSPWPHVYYATTGLNSFGELINDGEQITRQETLRTFTRENAWFLRMEDKIGSIEPGKLADIIVMDRDVFTVPDSDLRKTESVLTIVDGEVVHDTGAVS
jgi:predicted amidohydrolase YtcJ